VSRVILLVDAPFADREWIRLRLGDLMRVVDAIEIWDGTRALRRGAPRPSTGEAAPIPVREFATVADLARAIREHTASDVMFINMIDDSRKALGVLRALHQSCARYTLLAVDAQPYGNTAVRSAILSRTLRRNPPLAWIHETIRRRVARGWSPELIIAGGSMSLTRSETRAAGSETRVLWAHTAAYDEFLEWQPHTPDRTPTAVVFLDQYLEGHPDQALHGGPFCDPANYYRNLRRAFDAVEDSLGVPVEIAAHPAATYSSRDSRFGGRPIRRGRTLDMIGSAQLVLVHDSTAVGGAVLCGVPVTFLTDDGIQRNAVRRLAAQVMAGWLGKTVHNLDRDPMPAWRNELTVDRQRYDGYREAFLKRLGTPERPLWELFSDYVSGAAATQRFGDVLAPDFSL
jgi:hypothetical protein